MKKTDSLKIWIIAEIAAMVILIGAIVVKTVFAKGADDEADYTIPTEEPTSAGLEDIELPTDLLAEETEEPEAEDEEDDAYSLEDYPKETLEKLSEMTAAQKVSMLLVTSPEALCGIERVTATGDIFHEAYRDNPVSGLIFSDNNFPTEQDGMTMLKTLRGWSREETGMSLLLGYREQEGKDIGEISDRGFNLYMIAAGTEDAEAIGAEAIAHGMVPVLTMSLGEAAGRENTEEIVIIAQSNDADEITSAINGGNRLIYSTDDAAIRERLMEAIEAGEISEEALDHAAGYAITVRITLTENRPEDMEKEPEAPAQEPAAATTKKSNTSTKQTQQPQKTPEEEAAEALQKQLEEAAKEAQRQQEAAAREAQKQAEALQKQLEEAAKAAQNQQAAQE